MKSGETRADRRWQVEIALGLTGIALAYYQLYALPRGPEEFLYSHVLFPWPWAPMRGFTVEQLAAHAIWLVVGLPGVLLVGWGMARRFAPPAIPLGAVRWAPLVASALAATVTFLVMAYALRGKPITQDESTYVFQAVQLLHGRLGMTGPPGFPTGAEHYTVLGRAGLTGKYMFGEPLVQMVGVVLGLPPLLHVGLAALNVLLLHRLARATLGDPVAAALAAGAWAISPMANLTSATGLSHASAATGALAALLGAAVAARRPLGGAVLVAIGTGWMVMVRPQVALPVGGVALAWLGVALWRRRAWPSALAGGLVLAASAGMVAWYNILVCGDALKFPWFLQTEAEHYGLGNPLSEHQPWRYGLAQVLQNLVTVLVRLNGWWLGWPASFLVVLWWFRQGRDRRGLGLAGLAGLAVVVFEAGYYSPGVSDTGAVYHFELLIPGSLLFGQVVAAALRGWPRQAWTALAGMALMTPLFTIYQYDRLARLSHALHDPADALVADLQPPMLLFVDEHCDHRRERGWLNSGFPVGTREPDDPVVVMPRPLAKYQAAWIEYYGHRNCYFAQWVNEDSAYRVGRCADVRAALEDDRIVEKCWRNETTAHELGLVHH